MTNKERFLRVGRLQWGLVEREHFVDKVERAVGTGENKAMELEMLARIGKSEGEDGETFTCSCPLLGGFARGLGFPRP